MRKEKFIYIGLALIIAVMLLLDGSFSFTDQKSSVVYNLSDLKLTQIDLQCEVYITHGDNEKLVVEASKDVMNRLDISKQNGILSIKNKNDEGFLGFISNSLNLSGKVKIYINHSELDRIVVNNEAKIISVDYKPTHYQASCLEEEEDNDYAFFKVKKLSNLKQQLVKSLVEKTIFRVYSTI